VESTIYTDDPAPGITAVMSDPPTEPEFGDTDTSLGVKVNDSSITEWLSGVPTSK
jgi:hypothetical protein